MKRKSVFLVLALVLMVATGAAAQNFITIHWAQWAPADYLQKLSEDFTKETGIKVIVEQTPWETFVQKYNVEMVARSDAWDIIIGDSQDVGNMAAAGHYVDLTNWIKKNKVDKNFTAASLAAYGEWPKGGKKWFGVPVEGDSLGWAYRKDLFEDPANKKAFKAKFGYELDVPRDWQAILDIATFFHNPGKGFYGIAIYGDNGYDSLAMFAEQLMWTYGGGLGDYATYKLEGITNSKGSIAGIEFYKKLFQFVPPAFGDAFYVKCNDAFAAGIVPMTCNYFAFFPALANEATSKYAKVTGYFACPPQKGVDGKVRQFSALGGQGASVITYSKKKDLAMKWMEWFIRPEVQMKWAELGGYTCHIATLESDKFLKATPYNAAFKESMNIFADFWAVPEYGAMLESFSKDIGAFVIRGEGTAKSALDKLVADWTKTFKKAGYLK